MKLYDSGVYLVNGTELVADDAQAAAAIKSRTGREVAKAEAAQGTIAYGILKDHNVSGNMDKLQIKFDKLTSHDMICAHAPAAIAEAALVPVSVT